tara:strand:+ start:131 stop:568 length:438 start_codon:yes stop_codon:yes gene_type:complete
MGVYMKNLLSMLLVFSFLFTIGCEDDEATESEFNPLVGVWNMTSIVIESEGTTTIDADDDFNMVIIFNEDGTFSNQGAFDGESHSETGTWSTSENKLTIITDDVAEGEETDIWDYTVSGNSFLSMTIAENEDGYDFTYTYNFTKG